MTRTFLFAALGLALAGCNGPSPAFRGVPAIRVTEGGSTFDVRVRGERAEAVRLNTQWAPNLAAVEPQARAAITRVSGCTIRRLGGDQALIVARLDC